MKKKHLEEWRAEVELEARAAGYQSAKWNALLAWIDAQLAAKVAA